jgi:hypothetical protein
MMQCTISLIPVEVNSKEGKSRDCGEEWKGTEDVVVASFDEFLMIGCQHLIECHHCALAMMERRSLEYGKQLCEAIKNENPKIEMVLDEAFSQLD